MLKGVSLEASRGNFNAKYGHILYNALIPCCKKSISFDMDHPSNSSIEDSG
jgi:hypothetical protein